MADAGAHRRPPAGRLDLDAAQKARLATSGNTLRAQRGAFMGDTDRASKLMALVAGPPSIAPAPADC